MKLENTKVQMKKGVLEYCILSIIKKKEVYSSEIIFQLKQSKLLVVEGTIYPLLTRLKNSGLLSYEWVESTSGPPRKYYKMTDIGVEFLEELEATWIELNAAVQAATSHTSSNTDHNIE